jgi:O-antigen/teichoic acid export membrane protein
LIFKKDIFFDFQKGHFLFLMLLFGFFTSSLKTIPSVLLERRLKFEKIAVVDLAEQIIFTGLAVFLAWRGFGVDSWAWAVFFRSLVGVILIYFFSPWSIGLSFNFKAVSSLFKFGIPFQVNSLLAMLKDRLMNIFLWGILGSDGVGILGWAQRWAQMPLRFLMDQVIRVTFPAYSRIQHDKERMKRALEKSVFMVNLLIFPVLLGMGFLMPRVIEVFPKYQKWSIALVPFWLYLASFAFGTVTTPLVNAFNSVGKVRITLKLMIFWTFLTWLTVPVLAKKFGVNGAALGLLLVSSTSLVAWIWAKREFGISFIKVLLTPIVSSLIMLLGLLAVDQLTNSGLWQLVVLVLSGALVYWLVVFTLAKEECDWFVGTFKEWFLDLKSKRLL